MRSRQRHTWTISRMTVMGVTTIICLLAAFGFWASRAQIAGAVIGLGVIEVSTTRTAVQHPIGGVVMEIFKREGDHVVAGDVILRLDDRTLRSDLTVTEGALFETLANIARLEASLEDRPAMILDPLLVSAARTDPEVQGLMDRQQRQLDNHFDAVTTETQLLDEQVLQIEAQITGIEAQLDAKRDELIILATELQRGQELSAQGLIRTPELTLLDKTDVNVRGEIGRLLAQIAELRGKISEARLKHLSVGTDAAELMGVELSRLRPERTRLLEARSGLLADLELLDIRAPVNGRIINSQVFGVRSVVVAAIPLMMIVPEDEPVRAAVRVSAADVDQVYVGQVASLKFNAFNGRQTPILLGHVLQISADATPDPVSQKSFYNVTLALDSVDLSAVGGAELIPGMPVEAFLTGQSRTPLSYALRPIMFYFDRAFRDT